MAEPSAAGVPPRPHWTGYLPALLVVLALLAVLFLPFLVQRRIHALRDEIELLADPARTLTSEIRYLLASQESTLRGYLLTSDGAELRLHADLLRQEREDFQRLEALVLQLGAVPTARFVEFRTLAEQWHAQLPRGDLAAAATPPDGTGLPAGTETFRQALAAAGRLDAALVEATQERRHRIDRVEARAGLLQGALIVLALLAVATVIRQGGRIQRLRRESELRRAEVERALDRTARAVESRGRLIRGVTHDLKNPLGAADAYGELLELGLKGELTAPQARMVAGIRRSIRGALEMIEEMLELSRAETGSLPVERRETSLGALVHEVADDYQGAAQATGHALEAEVPPEPLVVFTDPARVRQVLGNLLSNAVKHTPPPGHIRVTVAPAPEDGSARAGRWAVVHVQDTGPGISPEERERIFDEFHRLPGTTAAGHGLGLAISRRIARLLGGDVTLESEPGRGARFTLWLPVRAAEPLEEGRG